MKNQAVPLITVLRNTVQHKYADTPCKTKWNDGRNKSKVTKPQVVRCSVYSDETTRRNLATCKLKRVSKQTIPCEGNIKQKTSLPPRC